MKCSIWDKSFSRKNNLIRHVKRKHLTNEFFLRLLQLSFYKQDAIDESFKKNGVKNIKKKCNFCEKELLRENSRKRHERICENYIEAVLTKSLFLKNIISVIKEVWVM